MASTKMLGLVPPFFNPLNDSTEELDERAEADARVGLTDAERMERLRRFYKYLDLAPDTLEDIAGLGTAGAWAGMEVGIVTDLCPHDEVEPVKLCTGEVVATVCVRCLGRLPAAWGCNDCSYAEVGAHGSPTVTRVMSDLCSRHQPEWAL